MNSTSIQLIQIAVSLVVGLGGGWLGAYMTMKIVTVKMEARLDAHEVWRGITDGAINRNTVDISAHRDDIRTHDIEIDEIMRVGGLQRIRRQDIR
jgi:hypothetical protein